MLKPQIWIRRGSFTGDMAMSSEADWKTLEKSYADFILTYAKLAEETQSSVYCIGTELDEFIKHRPEFWNELIGKVREVYHGKLTYAANWDEYARTPFWDQLDFIGVNAYFPLCEKQTPTVETLTAGWQPWKAKLKALSKEHKKTHAVYRIWVQKHGLHWKKTMVGGPEPRKCQFKGTSRCHPSHF